MSERRRVSSRQSPVSCRLSLRAVGAGDVDVAIFAAARYAHAPRVAADLAVLDEAAFDIRLHVDFHRLAAIRARHEMLVVHA